MSAAKQQKQRKVRSSLFINGQFRSMNVCISLIGRIAILLQALEKSYAALRSSIIMVRKDTKGVRNKLMIIQAGRY